MDGDRTGSGRACLVDLECRVRAGRRRSVIMDKRLRMEHRKALRRRERLRHHKDRELAPANSSDDRLLRVL